MIGAILVVSLILGCGLILVATLLATLICHIKIRELRALRAEVQQTKDEIANRKALTFIGDEAMVYCCPMGVIIQPSPAFCKLFGYTSSELVGRNVKMLMPLEIASKHDGYLERYRNTNERHIIGTSGRDLDAIKKDGSVFPILLAISEPVMPTGEKLLLATIKDITSQKYAELSRLASSAGKEGADTKI